MKMASGFPNAIDKTWTQHATYTTRQTPKSKRHKKIKWTKFLHVCVNKKKQTKTPSDQKCFIEVEN